MRYLVTGHTGFKGAWLVLMLRRLGHEVGGIALDPEPGGLFELAGLGRELDGDRRIDIRDAEATAAAVREARPDVVIHLAAQPLVRESYRDPRTTFETNVMGTLNVLEAVARVDSVRASLIITTDKVYRNVGQVAGYVEDDALGAADPYSSSKAMADILTQSWIASFPGAPTAIARGGNVIGGGDVSRDRLLPDVLRSFAANSPAQLRYPNAVRPWQHVLDCLDGYLAIVDALLAGSGTGAWNIGPGRESFVSVGSVADIAADLWGDGASWQTDGSEQPHEAEILSLDAGRAERELGWSNTLPFPLSLEWTVAWERARLAGTAARDVTDTQIDQYYSLKREARA